MKDPVNIFWFRRDLRLEDNVALFHALKDELPVLPIFIFDTNILDDLEDRDDARVTFIHQQLFKINEKLKSHGSRLWIFHGKPEKIWEKLVKEYDIKKLYANRDYEPYARERDKKVYELLEKQGIPFKSFKDHVIFEKNEVLKKDGTPYAVYTPYKNLWRENFDIKEHEPFDSEKVLDDFLTSPWKEVPELGEIGFEKSLINVLDYDISKNILKDYADKRDFPSEYGTTFLSTHLRFGTVGLRKLIKETISYSDTFVNELVWREFFQMILWHYPRVIDENYNKKYDAVPWRNDEQGFEKWCKGQTGYPIVDAGMRELNETGLMHNRVRMIVASFLTKHLLIDWRWGEAYFAKKLLDYELASNNGNWQWAAGTGVDAQPYFRVFNPYTQADKFDKERKYISKWVPEYQNPSYVDPIIEHSFARQRAIDTYKRALG